MSKSCFAGAALILAAAINGCTNSTEPSLGSLQITVSGLPNLAQAAITITGPSGSFRAVTATTTLSALQPGTYTIAASDVTIAGVIYVASPPSQNVSVQVSDTAATATVTYAVGGAGTWTIKASMPTARAGLGIGVGNGLLYAVGGWFGASLNPVYLPTVEAYNPLADTWTTAASMPTARRFLGVEVVNGILYAVGGENGTGSTNALEAYDPSTNTWTTLASMPTARSGMGVGVVNGILYAVGGYDGSQYLRTVEAYDPSTNAWITLAPLPGARGHLGVGVVNGLLYAVGGSYLVAGRHFSSDEVQAYDPSVNAWTRKAWMPTPRSSLGVGVVNEILYAIGGYYSDPSTTGGILRTVEAFDPSTNTWATKAPLPAWRADLVAGAVNGTLHAVGGVSPARRCAPRWGCRTIPVPVGLVEVYTP